MKTIFAIYTLFLLAVFVLNGGITQASNQDSLMNEQLRTEKSDQNINANLHSEAKDK